MNSLEKTSLFLVLLSGLTACSSSDDTDTDLGSTGDNSVNDVLLNIDTLVDDNGNPNTTIDGVNNSRGNNNRSPQGIPDNGNDRRNNARNQRGRTANERDFFLNDIEIRTYDGTENNQNSIDWGSSFSHLQRIGEANYSDGISSMIYTDRAGAREISNTIVNQDAGENIPNAFGASDFSWQWGQFLDHDIDLTDGSADEPQNIPVPTGDRFFDPAGTGIAVIPFNRALFDPNTGTDTTNVREQENEITSWIDGSCVFRRKVITDSGIN